MSCLSLTFSNNDKSKFGTTFFHMQDKHNLKCLSTLHTFTSLHKCFVKEIFLICFHCYLLPLFKHFCLIYYFNLCYTLAGFLVLSNFATFSCRITFLTHCFWCCISERRKKWELQKKENPNTHIPEPWPAGRNFKRNVLITHFIVCLIVVIISVIVVAVS